MGAINSVCVCVCVREREREREREGEVKLGSLLTHVMSLHGHRVRVLGTVEKVIGWTCG